MWYQNIRSALFSFLTIHASDAQTDGRTELRQQYPALHYMQSHGKNPYTCICTAAIILMLWWLLTKTDGDMQGRSVAVALKQPGYWGHHGTDHIPLFILQALWCTFRGQIIATCVGNYSHSTTFHTAFLCTMLFFFTNYWSVHSL